MRRSAPLAIGLALLPAGCGGAGSAASQAPREITVFAASSLTESFSELGERLEAARGGTTVRFNFASSSDLAVQISEGAPADVFASADTVSMGVVEDEGLAEDPELFATNRLVVLTPADDPAGIESIEDLARPGVKVVLAASEVPVGRYAREGLDRLGILAAVESNVVSNEEDVKAVVTKVALGEADAGVAYVTDVTDDIEADVREIEFPTEAGVVAGYPIAILPDGPNPDGASAFVELVTSDEGLAVLERYGFGAP